MLSSLCGYMRCIFSYVSWGIVICIIILDKNNYYLRIKTRVVIKMNAQFSSITFDILSWASSEPNELFRAFRLMEGNSVRIFPSPVFATCLARLMLDLNIRIIFIRVYKL
jgi:hypothetical protein